MGKQVVEDCLILDLAWLMRLAPIKMGQAGKGKIEWSCRDMVIGALRFRLDLREAEAGRLILRYTLAVPESERKPVQQVIVLTALPQHFGGHRWWMRCPVTGELNSYTLFAAGR